MTLSLSLVPAGAEWNFFESLFIGIAALGLLHGSPAWISIMGLWHEHLARLLGVAPLHR